MPDFLNDFPLKDLATLGFLLTLGFYTLFSFILYYHWHNFSPDQAVTKITYIFYAVLTLPLVLILSIMTLII